MVLVLVWVGLAVVGYAIGNAKGRGALGAVLGLCLGIIGVVVIACLSPKPGYGRASYHRYTDRRSRDRRPPVGPSAATLSSGARWASDPHRRHEMRWWNGAAWTDQVSDGGVLFRDPLGAAPTPPTASIPGWNQPGPGAVR